MQSATLKGRNEKTGRQAGAAWLARLATSTADDLSRFSYCTHSSVSLPAFSASHGIVSEQQSEVGVASVAEPLREPLPCFRRLSRESSPDGLRFTSIAAR